MSWIDAYIPLVVNGGTKNKRVVTHRCKNLKRNHKDLTDEDYKEIHSGVLDDPIKKARYSLSTHLVSISRRIDDNDEGRSIFVEEESVLTTQITTNGRRHTIHSSEHGIGNLPGPPPFVYAELEHFERKEGSRDSFRSWGLP